MDSTSTDAKATASPGGDATSPGPAAVWPERALVAVMLLIVVAATWMRVVDLSRLPGLNGDEAWYGVAMQRILQGTWITRTPSNNPLNPFYCFLLLPFEAAFGPAVWVIRAPAVLSGLALVVLAFLTTRRTLGHSAAVVVTLLVASLPLNILYARFGWDASQLGLATCLVCYFALRGSYWAQLASLSVAIVVHPTSLFLLPMLLVIAIAQVWETQRTSRALLTATARWLVAGVALSVLVWLLFPGTRGIAPGGSLEGEFGSPLSRLISAQGLSSFAALWGQLISGLTVYRYLVGPQADSVARVHDVVIWCTLATAVVSYARAMRRGRARRITLLALPVGLGLSLATYYVVCGADILVPSRERYGAWCVYPATLVLGTGVSLLGDGRRLRIVVWGAVALLSALMLWSVQRNYLHEYEVSGGRSHRGFRTSQAEPKQVALDAIRRHATSGAAVVVATDWWSYWPLLYLAAGDDTVRLQGGGNAMYSGREVIQLEHVRNYEQRLGRRVYVVTYSENPLYQRLIAEYGPAGRVAIVEDAEGRAILGVFRRPSSAAARNR